MSFIWYGVFIKTKVYEHSMQSAYQYLCTALARYSIFINDLT